MGMCTILATEVWAIIQGFHLAWEKGVRNLIVETNSIEAHNGISRRQLINNNYNALFKECGDLLRKDWTVKLKYVFKECNQTADMLAYLSLELDNGELKEWISPPNKVLSVSTIVFRLTT